MKGLIVFPLILIFGLAILSQIGLTTYASSLSTEIEYEYLYDETGHAVCFLNGTAVGEEGTIQHFWDQNGGEDYWHNATMEWHIIYNTPNGVNSDFNVLKFSMGKSLGLIGILVAVIALGTIAGLKIVGSGIGEFSVRVIVLASGLISLWAVFSLLAMNLITSIPFLGPVFYYFLTAMYAIGLFQILGGGE